MEAKSNKAILLRRLAAIAQLYFLALTWQSYLGSRDYIPSVSLFGSLEIPTILHMVVFILMVASVVFQLVKPARIEGAMLFLLFYLIAVLIDVNRFAQYQIHLLAFMFVPGSLSDKGVDNFIRFVFGFTYLFWGVNLLTDEYAKHVVPYLLPGENSLFHTIAEVLPWIFIMVGLLLLLLSNKAIFMICFILHLSLAVNFAFGDSIYIMTPWNLLFAGLCLLVAKVNHSEEGSWKVAIVPVILVLWCSAAYLGVTHSGLGFSYYNGKSLSLTLYINSEETESLPASIRESLVQSPDNENPYLQVDSYVGNTFHSTLLPIKSNYHAIGKQFCSNLTDKNNAILILVSGYGTVQGRDFEILTYNELK